MLNIWKKRYESFIHNTLISLTIQSLITRKFVALFLSRSNANEKIKFEQIICLIENIVLINQNNLNCE